MRIDVAARNPEGKDGFPCAPLHRGAAGREKLPCPIAHRPREEVCRQRGIYCFAFFENSVVTRSS